MVDENKKEQKMKKNAGKFGLTLVIASAMLCSSGPFAASFETGLKIDTGSKTAGEGEVEVGTLSPGIEQAQTTAEDMAKKSKISQIFTADIIEKYKSELAELEAIRKDVQKKIDNLGDEVDAIQAKEAEAMAFYKLQQKFVYRLSDDLKISNEQLDKMFCELQNVAGGYTGAQQTLDKDTANATAKAEALRSQQQIKNEATALLAERSQLLGYNDKGETQKDKLKSVDKTSPPWIEFSNKQKALLRRHRRIAHAIALYERRAEFYQEIKGMFLQHKDAAVAWLDYAENVNEQYYELSLDLDFEKERIDQLIAAGGMKDTLIAMASIGKAAGEIESFVKIISGWGNLTPGPVIGPPPDVKDLEGISLDDIVK